jgi:hypothetical protein
MSMRLLYEFFFRNQKAELAAYGISLLIALGFAIIGDLVLGQPQRVMLYEGCAVATVVFASVVLVYVYKAAQKDAATKRLSELLRLWREFSPRWQETAVMGISIFAGETMEATRREEAARRGLSELLRVWEEFPPAGQEIAVKVMTLLWQEEMMARRAEEATRGRVDERGNLFGQSEHPRKLG